MTSHNFEQSATIICVWLLAATGRERPNVHDARNGSYARRSGFREERIRKHF